MIAKWIEEKRPIRDKILLVDPMFAEILLMVMRYGTEIIDDKKRPWVRFREITVITTKGSVPALMLETTVGDFVCYAFLAGLDIKRIIKLNQ